MKYRSKRIMAVLIPLVFFSACLLAQEAGSAEIASGAAFIEEHKAQHAEPGMFDFDPFILVSQVINFFLLLFILNKFIFKPLGTIVEERHAEVGRIKIAAENDYKEAKALKEEYQTHLDKIEEEVYELKQKALAETNDKIAEILEDAHQKAAKIIEQGEMDLFMERQTAWAHIREDVVQLTMTASEKVIGLSMDDEMHRKLIGLTIDKLESSIPDKKE